MFQLKTYLRILLSGLTFRATLFGVAAIVASLAAITFAPYVSEDLAELLGGQAVDSILSIVASSMLAVVTFSLSTLVASYANVGNIATPRATALIIEDAGAKNALSTFLGAFIFSIVSLVALSTKYYGPKGRVILFFVTVVVLFLVISTMIRWIGQLARFSLLANLIEMIEAKVRSSINKHPELFSYSSSVLEDVVFESETHIKSIRCGFVRNIDLKSIGKCAESERRKIHLVVSAGDFVARGDVIARVSGAKATSEDFAKNIADAFDIGPDRRLSDDPRFGFIILSEIGSKALSPGVNDQGTAIQVLSSLFQLIQQVADPEKIAEAQRESAAAPYLTYKRVTLDDLFDDAFRSIARDGAGMLEVMVFLNKGLQRLSTNDGLVVPAKNVSQYSLELAAKAMESPKDLERLVSVVSN